VVEATAFFELPADNVLDPDVAVKELESIAYLLGQLEVSEKREFIAFTRVEAERASSIEYREFLRQPGRGAELAVYQRTNKAAKQQLGEHQFSKLIDEGKQMTLDDAVALALSLN